MKYVVLLLYFVFISVNPQRYNQNRIPSTANNQYLKNGCTCVPPYRCNDKRGSSDGAGLIDVRLYQDQKPQQCQNVGDVCCLNLKGPANKEGSYRAQPSCGINPNADDNFDIDPRILGGGVAPFGKYPWMVALLIKPYQFKCGGSLIHPQVVLTAAHCVDGVPPANLLARLGEWDTTSEIDHGVYKHQDVNVADVVYHPKYQKGSKNLFDDVALVFLQTKAQIDYHINTVCLPQPNQRFLNQRCFAAGWGKEYFGKGIAGHTTLKEVDLPMIDPHSCQNRLKGVQRLGCRFCLHDTFICAGGEQGKDTCEGDGGSPLVCHVDGVGIQAGIVSWGIGCGNNIPAAYVDVSRYLQWIDMTVQQYFHLQKSYFSYTWNKPYSYEGDYEMQKCKNNINNQKYNKFPAGHQCLKGDNYG